MLAMLAMLAAVCQSAVRVGVSKCFCLSPGTRKYRPRRRYALGDAVLWFGEMRPRAFLSPFPDPFAGTAYSGHRYEYPQRHWPFSPANQTITRSTRRVSSCPWHSLCYNPNSGLLIRHKVGCFLYQSQTGCSDTLPIDVL
jgi:hypothetical protein